jgi:serine/threonine protein kinase
MSTLSPEQWRDIIPYLDQALAMTDEERATWLSSLAKQNPALVAQLRSLLDEQRASAQEGFLEERPAPLPLAPRLAGQTVGAYRLLSQIGQGGMGSVWLGERSDGRFERQVAVKFVAKELSNRQFAIKTDKPNVKVCWQVTGIRQDAWANAHRIPVEELKPEGERGLYIHPELFGAPAEKSITLARHPDVQKLAKERSLQQPSSANH